MVDFRCNFLVIPSNVEETNGYCYGNCAKQKLPFVQVRYALVPSASLGMTQFIVISNGVRDRLRKVVQSD